MPMAQPFAPLAVAPNLAISAPLRDARLESEESLMRVRMASLEEIRRRAAVDVPVPQISAFREVGTCSSATGWRWPATLLTENTLAVIYICGFGSVPAFTANLTANFPAPSCAGVTRAAVRSARAPERRSLL